MTDIETSGSKPSHKNQLELLRAQLPNDFLDQMLETGITQDYANFFTGPLMYAEALRHPDTSPAMTTLSRGTLIDTIRTVKTYSEYWRERIENYNNTAEEKRVAKIIPDRVFDLVTSPTQAGELDEVALRMRDLADRDEDPDTLAVPVIKLCAMATSIIYTHNGQIKSHEILERNGITPESI